MRKRQTTGKKIDIEQVVVAIEADAGEQLHDLRQALAETQLGLGRVTTPKQILVRQAPEFVQRAGRVLIDLIAG